MSARQRSKNVVQGLAVVGSQNNGFPRALPMSAPCSGATRTGDGGAEQWWFRGSGE